MTDFFPVLFVSTQGIVRHGASEMDAWAWALAHVEHPVANEIIAFVQEHLLAGVPAHKITRMLPSSLAEEPPIRTCNFARVREHLRTVGIPPAFAECRTFAALKALAVCAEFDRLTVTVEIDRRFTSQYEQVKLVSPSVTVTVYFNTAMVYTLDVKPS